MRGLLDKELQLLWDCWHIWPAVLLFMPFCCLFLWFDMGMLFCLVISALPLAVFAKEEDDRWERFAGTLPLSPGKIVSARYLLTLLLVFGFAAFCFLLGCFQCCQGGVIDPRELWRGTRLLLSLSVMAPALCFPPMYRWGFLRGGMVDAVIVAAFIGFSVLWRRHIQIPLVNLYFWIQPVLFAASWRLSIRWYSRREF